MDERVKESKDAMRKRLAALPIAEKLHIVEQLAERQKLIQSATYRKPELAAE